MNSVSRPSYTRCEDYSPENVRRAMAEVLASAGGLDWVRPGMKIALKLNLCAARKPETATTTHPALVTELVRLLRARGADVIIGDSPGEPFTAPILNHVYNTCGLQVCAEAGAKLNDNYSHHEVPVEDGVSIKRLECCDWLLDCDAVINFCKLKSHGLMGMTAAVKNLYGIIPGTRKSEYHFMHTDPMDFATLLVDLNEFLKPQLVLCDAVDVMEGNGPTQGTPRHLGLLIAGTDPYEIDRFCASVLKISEEEIPYLCAAKQRGLLSADGAGTYEADASPFRLEDFVRSGATSSWFLSDPADSLGKRILKKSLYVIMRSKPQADPSCTGCGHCARSCPAQAITIRSGKAVIDRKKCVRCFCCQEFCPFGAMKAKRSWLAQLASGK